MLVGYESTYINCTIEYCWSMDLTMCIERALSLMRDDRRSCVLTKSR